MKGTAASQLQLRVKGRFNRSAPDHHRHCELQSMARNALADMIHRERASLGHLVEIGCGQAPLLAPLSQTANYTVGIGIDLSERLLANARRNFEVSKHPLAKAEWIQADAQQLPLREGSVDVLLSSMALHWCSDARKALGEVRRVLRPGGRAGIAVPLFPSLARLERRLARLGIDAAINPFWRAGEWQRLYGLDVIAFEQLDHETPFPDTVSALGNIRGIGGNCLWRKDSLEALPAAPATDADAIGQWRRAMRQPLWREPISLGFHIGLWILGKPETGETGAVE